MKHLFPFLIVAAAAMVQLPAPTVHAAPTSDASARPAQQEKGWLGIEMYPDNQQTGQGVRIRRCVPSSPAASAGLQPNDVVIQVDGQAVTSPQALIAAMKHKRVGQTVSLLLKETPPRTVEVHLSPYPKDVQRLGEKMIGQSAPSTHAVNIKSGKRETVSPQTSTVQIVELWATWCGPCQQIQPLISRWVDVLQGPGFDYVGVAQDPVAAVEKYLTKHPTNYRVVADPDGDVSAAYWSYATPTFVLIDRDGKILDHQSGTQGAVPIFQRAQQLLEQYRQE